MGFSWEQSFTAELIARFKDSYLAYSKSKLNDSYFGQREAEVIKGVLPDLGI